MPTSLRRFLSIVPGSNQSSEPDLRLGSPSLPAVHLIVGTITFCGRPVMELVNLWNLGHYTKSPPRPREVQWLLSWTSPDQSFPGSQCSRQYSGSDPCDGRCMLGGSSRALGFTSLSGTCGCPSRLDRRALVSGQHPAHSMLERPVSGEITLGETLRFASGG
jgi:hypothetical protein